MSVRQAGAASSRSDDVITRGEVQALIAAASGGGGSAELFTKFRPPVGGYITAPASNGNTPTYSIGQLVLGALTLPPGSYDTLACRTSTATTGAAIRAAAYEVGSDGGLGALVFDSGTPTSAATSGFIAIPLPSTLVVGAAGRALYVGLVQQGSAATGVWCYAAGGGLPRLTASGVQIDLGGITTMGAILVTGVNGAAPATPTYAFQDTTTPPRVAFRRSA